MSTLHGSGTVHDTLLVNETRLQTPLNLESVTSGFLSTHKQTTYQPSTGIDPSGRMEHDQRLEAIKQEMNGHWAEPDESLIERFFTWRCISQENIKHVKRELYNSKQKRWIGIPRDVPKENILVLAFLKIFQAIQRHAAVGPDRDVLDTQNHPIPTHDGATLKPDLFVSVLNDLVSPATVHETKPSSFKSCLGIIEAKRHQRRNDAEDSAQLATYSREVLMAQSNRHFVPCALITERLLEFYVFYRSGAVRSSKFDYHTHPDRACEVLASLLKYDVVALGFDCTIFYKTPSIQCIRTMEPSGTGVVQEVTYTVEMLLMRSYTIVGAGTTFWRVSRDKDHNCLNRYIIKDSWVPSGEDDDAAFLEEAGALQGVAPLVHSETVKAVNRAGDIVHNVRSPQRDHRVHRRFVYGYPGKLLEHFETPMQFLTAFKASVEGHQNLHDKGIMHRDIVPWNILINSNPRRDNHGALIDLQSAQRTSTALKRTHTTPGSYRFLSRNALRGRPDISHLDDLESFFHVFCFFVAGHSGPLLSRARVKEPRLDSFGTELALYTKEDMFENPNFKLVVQIGYFKAPMADLAVQLHSFFHQKYLASQATDNMGSSNSPSSPSEDYSIFVDHISNAIHKLSLVCGDYRGLYHGRIPACSPLNLNIGSTSKVEEDATSTANRSLPQESKSCAPPKRYPSRDRKRTRTSV